MDKLAQVGHINVPPGVANYGTAVTGGLTVFVGNILKFLIVIASLYSFFNLIMAGYAFISAGEDPKKVEAAWAKIWQTLLGLALTASAFAIIAAIGWIFYRNPFQLLRLTIFGPTV